MAVLWLFVLASVGKEKMLEVRSMKEDVISKLKVFIENEARSCSMDFGCVTPLYVYRMWGGSASLEEIERAMSDVRRMM